MPTSPRDLAGGTGWYQPTARLSNPRADVGIGPYAKTKILPFNRASPGLSGVPLHTRRKRGHPLQAGEGKALCTLLESARYFLHKLYLVHKNKIRSLAATDLATKKEERKMKKMKKSYLICLYYTNQM